MKLFLLYPPDPPNAANLAAVIVRQTREAAHVELDYSPASLKQLDDIICGFRDGKRTEDDMSTALFMFGCYFGEVLIRSLNGTWAMPEDTKLSKTMLPYFPFMVTVMKNGLIWNPIGKTFKLFKDGMVESTEYMYRVVASKSG